MSGLVRRWHSSLLALWLALVVHVDWHLARPAHHRLSLAWSQHWLFAAVGFALAGWLIAVRWPDRPWRAAAAIVGWGLFIAQGLEPVLEVLSYEGRFGYPADPGRWAAFGTCVAAGIPALVAALMASRRMRRRTGADTG